MLSHLLSTPVDTWERGGDCTCSSEAHTSMGCSGLVHGGEKQRSLDSVPLAPALSKVEGRQGRAMLSSLGIRESHVPWGIQGKPSAQSSRTCQTEKAGPREPGSAAAREARQQGSSGWRQQARMCSAGSHFPCCFPRHDPAVRGWGQTPESHLEPSRDGTEADGDISFPSDLADAVEKTRKPAKEEEQFRES